MSSIILLAMHGMPPSDFSKQDLAEWGKLHSTLSQIPSAERPAAKKKYAELDQKLRSWPRSADNDAYFTASYRLAERMKNVSGCEVLVGFNEFCNPSIEDAFRAAGMAGSAHVVVITPMMTRGGSHSESDIPAAIRRAKTKYPQLSIDYVWPFDEGKIAEFLSAQLTPYLTPKSSLA